MIKICGLGLQLWPIAERCPTCSDLRRCSGCSPSLHPLVILCRKVNHTTHVASSCESDPRLFLMAWNLILNASILLPSFRCPNRPIFHFDWLRTNSCWWTRILGGASQWVSGQRYHTWCHIQFLYIYVSVYVYVYMYMYMYMYIYICDI